MLLTSGGLAVTAGSPSSLDFRRQEGHRLIVVYNGKTCPVRAFENIVYVSNPIDTAHEKMNIYVPEQYYHGEKINGYSAKTAPIFFYSRIAGYMPGEAPTIGGGWPGQKSDLSNLNDTPEHRNMVMAALTHGYVVAAPAARGRSSAEGKAPAAIVDLKAAVRYLRYNDKVLPGDANRIVSDGTSAGGAISALLGATGNSADYQPYLDAIGAAPAKDDIFATQAYCPITNLEHADAAYEWQFKGINTAMDRPHPGEKTGKQTHLSRAQILVSQNLAAQFPAYVNTLGLKNIRGQDVRLNDDGTGTLVGWICHFIRESAQRELDKGNDLSQYSSWLEVKDGKVGEIKWDIYLQYLHRQKLPPAFDALDLSAGENQEMGTDKVDKRHFTAYSYAHSQVPDSEMADALTVRLMNPMNYIGTPGATTSPHWRICHGTYDKDTSLAIPVILGTYLMNHGYDVQLLLTWAQPHGGDYDSEALFAWIDSLVK